MTTADTKQQLDPILDVRDLQVSITGEQGKFDVVSGVSFKLFRGRTLGIVGESGCGKSITSSAIMRLLPRPAATIEMGQVLYGGKDLCRVNLDEMYKIRGNRIAMIFQEPMSALNPVMRVGDQVAESLIRHGKAKNRKDALQIALNLFESVGIPAADQRIFEFPHRLSGGMRQRVMIAMALACGPDVLIADEPTTALDVTIQAQILNLINDLKVKSGLAVLLVSHDLGLIAEYADDLAVMYAGGIVESGPSDVVMNAPKHPYTKALLKSRPELTTPRKSILNTIEGAVPHASAWPAGCRFHPRCGFATDVCKKQLPVSEVADSGHQVQCHNWRQVNG